MEVRDPLEQTETESVRISLDLPAETVAFLESFAAYRNALNALQGRKVKKWTRKSAAEAFVLSQVERVMMQMAQVFADHGSLPPPEKEKEMLAYAKRVLAASDKR